MLLFFSDTTDGRHNCVCGVHHMEYLLTADRLGRNFCEKAEICAQPVDFLLQETESFAQQVTLSKAKFQLQTQIRRRAWKRETLQQS